MKKYIIPFLVPLIAVVVLVGIRFLLTPVMPDFLIGWVSGATSYAIIHYYVFRTPPSHETK